MDIELPGFDIERELGEGAMATVYLATQRSLQRKVALKVMAAALAADPSFAERFLREGRTLARLSHPNTVTIHDIGNVGSCYYMAMEYLPNGTLKERIQQGLDPELGLVYVRQVAAALGYAHSQGLVHRDVKPANILFRADGTAVLSDFGIAKSIEDNTQFTQVGFAVGTPSYMSPEQARGQEIDGRADLYALGVVLYEILTGKLPYNGKDSLSTALAHLTEPLPELPIEQGRYQDILRQLLAKDPAERFPTAGALIAARAGLAVGAALMMPATLSIVRHVFQDERERALAIGIWASVASAGAALGPVVGGVLLEFFWWGSVFLINVPVVVVALLLALPAIPACGGQSRRPWDALGSLQVMFGLVGVVYAIKELSTRAPDFGLAVLAALGGMLCLYLFVRRQRRAREPMIDFALFRNRRFARGVAVALVATMALVGMELVFSQHLQLVQGLTPLKAGLFVLPIPLASLVVGPLAGWLVPRWGENRVMCASLLLGSAGLLGLALSYQSATGAQLASLVLLGVGFGGAMTAASTAVMLNVDEQSSGMAAAIEDVSYELGGVIGVTLLGSLMSFVYGMSLRLPSAELPARVRDSLDDALLVAEGLAPEVASRLVELARQAFDQAFVAVLLAAAALLFLSAMAVLRQPRPATEPAPPAPHTR
ncbi:MFS transporter [Pseudomonas aeruginosa]|uniref:MFS transporter n=12 Tax=Gammaproteobacteria TaxID=1236 RepID=UPI00215640B8|nr:MFS transporter [Pseudomonas aeruginosa]